jgi:hypothetical protein
MSYWLETSCHAALRMFPGARKLGNSSCRTQAFRHRHAALRRNRFGCLGQKFREVIRATGHTIGALFPRKGTVIIESRAQARLQRDPSRDVKSQCLSQDTASSPKLMWRKGGLHAIDGRRRGRRWVLEGLTGQDQKPTY